ncbi:Outer membrane protein beta-barrel domain-containing protein [Hymenobacter daecheongensis DSM 21074]|uniref:Outer membrane protein beta-barrel domain-containing protein n=1 Tax=Hymenobacter daecheongensis DSM 21074 TaxID=1121955 RepID=A0A1M6C260_9BACT|nr:outer membrane beta-barrel protein [Hymenobacter daecheongensis]SHI54911.1 Outer membrane protein beta-barrel domain-containing protein [Hymenobacter daecheongensis DSM 21074]
MKKLTLFILAALAAHLSHGQQTEFSAHLTSGLAAFRGPAAAADAFIVGTQWNSGRYYTDNPYGRQPGISYGGAGQVQRIGPKKGVLGVQAGYEVLRSRVRISNVFEGGTDAGISVKGHTALANQLINLHPFFGHRFALKALDLDLTAGPEVGWLLSSHEKGRATTTGGRTYTTHTARYRPIDVDVRARLNLTAYYRRTGLSLGYSAGLSDYRRGYVGGTNGLFSQVFRVGLAYRIYGL